LSLRWVGLETNYRDDCESLMQAFVKFNQTHVSLMIDACRSLK